MADMVLGFAIEKALSIVLSLITEEIKGAWGLEEELTKLRDSLTMVHDLLQDAEEQQMSKMAVRHWLEKLKIWAYVGEDLLDDLGYEVLRRKVEIEVNHGEKKMHNLLKFTRCIPFVQTTTFHIKMSHKVKNVNDLLDQIKNEAFDFGFRVIPADRNASDMISWDRVTDSIIDHPVVAREAEVSKLVNLLAASRDQQTLSVVAIAGMGGIGKTTVAKLVCRQVMEKKLFDVKMWICVSTDFDEKKILGEMLQTLNKNTGGITNKDATLRHLEEELKGKSFLLVLDNVWNQDYDKWDSLKSRLLSISRNNGNAVVVTTRSTEVASIMDTSLQCRHKLKLLSDDECWSIIQERVSGNSRASIPSDMEAIGKEIASKCRGLPLVARVLGGTLHRNTKKEEWLAVRNSNVLNVSASEVSIESILRLSFDRLPSYLKPCVTYCSIFPKSDIIWKGELIYHWMAHGLLDSSMEDTGEKYFNELLLSSFLLDVECDRYGDIEGARMHDLVHELASSISKSDIFTWEKSSAETANDISHIQHLNITSYAAPRGPMRTFLKSKTKALRTLFATTTDVFYDSFKFKSLRVLKLRDSNVKALPAAIGKLKHLRVLDVSFTEITALPKSITKLCYLQALVMVECKLLERLPKRLKKLVSLRHLIFSYEKQMPRGVSCLRNLQKLSYFAVGSNRGGNIQELECLNDLSDELTISNLELVTDEEEAKKANLQSKTKLGELALVWTCERESASYNDEEVLKGLQPFEDLQILTIKNYLGEKFPSWLLTMKVTRFGGDSCTLKNLMAVELKGCRRCREIPELGHLPMLRTLEIVGLDNVRYLSNELYSSPNIESEILFPVLQRLVVGSMKSLVEWKAPITYNIFPCLEELQIFKCPALTSIPMSHLSSLAEFRMEHCDAFGEVVFDEDHPLTSLRLLHLINCGNLISFQSIQGLTSLRDLRIHDCNRLTSLPRGLTLCPSLDVLDIWHCQELRSVPEDLRELQVLKFLQIAECPNLTNFTGDILKCFTQLKSLGISCYYDALNSIQYIPSLEFLAIVGRNDFKSLPDQLQSLTVLKRLWILCFNGLEALPEWLGNLSSLEYLEICDCENLMHLPSASTLQGLSQLKELSIENCPLLKEICAKRSGSEWSKISHIPKIIMDEVVLQAS